MNREEYYEYVRLLDSLQPSEPVLGKCNDGKMKLKKKKRRHSHIYKMNRKWVNFWNIFMDVSYYSCCYSESW